MLVLEILKNRARTPLAQRSHRMYTHTLSYMYLSIIQFHNVQVKKLICINVLLKYIIYEIEYIVYVKKV